MNEVADILHVDKGDLYSRLKEFKAGDYPFMCTIIDAVKNMRLLEKGEEESPAQKGMQTKIKRVEQGYYLGPRVFGYVVRDGIPIETGDLKKVKGVLDGFRIEGKGVKQLAD
jgi:hypothetical protein